MATQDELNTSSDVAWRDYATDGVPSSGAHEPVKSDIRAHQRLVSSSITSAAEGIREFTTHAELASISGTVDGQVGQVVGPDAGTHTEVVAGSGVENVGRYRWDVGDTEWIRTGALPVQTAEESADLAEKWAEEPEDSEVTTGKYSALHHAAKASQTAASIEHALRTAIPTVTNPVVGIVLSPTRWLIRTPVFYSGSGDYIRNRSDYMEIELLNYGPSQSPVIAHCWGINAQRARINGQIIEFYNANGMVPSTWESAIYVGLLADPFNDTYYNRYGFGHGRMNYLGLYIGLNGGSNLRDTFEVGDVYRGSNISFSGSYAPLLIDDTVIGTHGISHIFDATYGLRVAQQLTVSLAGVGSNNDYVAMMLSDSANRAIATKNGSHSSNSEYTAFDITAEDGSQLPNTTADIGWEPNNANPAPLNYYMFHSQNPSVFQHMNLIYGAPVSGGNWDDCTTSKAFILSNADGNKKVYVNSRSGSTGLALTGTTSFQAMYRILVQAPV